MPKPAAMPARGPRNLDAPDLGALALEGGVLGAAAAVGAALLCVVTGAAPLVAPNDWVPKLLPPPRRAASD